MEYTFLKERYPQITELYYDFVNSDVYANHPVVEVTEPARSKAIDKAFEELQAGNTVCASDILTDCATTYEHSGFILGFTLAMNLMQESLFDKVQSFSESKKGA